LEMESRFNDYVPRADWIARYVKYGFTVLYTDTVTKKEIESAVKSVVI
jgi:hypothetical protein